MALVTPVFSTNKTDCHYIAEILLKVALNTITLTPNEVTHLDSKPCWHDTFWSAFYSCK